MIFYCACKHFEKRESQVCLMCPNCKTEMKEVEALSEGALRDLFAEYLGGLYGAVRIGNLEYAPADVLSSVDPREYRCKFENWLENGTSEGKFVEFDGETFCAIN